MRIVCIVLLGGVVLAAIVGAVARRPLSAWLIETWLAQRGVDSAIAVERLDLSGAVAQVRLGKASNPDLTIQKLTIAYRWHGLMPELTAVDLDRPVLRARYDGHQFDLGQIGALIGGTTAPSTTPAAQPAAVKPGATRTTPTITARNARLRIEAPAGTLRLSGFADFSGGKVRSLSVSAEPVTLKFPGMTTDIGSAVLSKNPSGHVRARVSGNITADDRQGAEVSAATASIDIVGLRWYRDANGAFHLSGRAQAQLSATAARLQGTAMSGLEAHITAAGKLDTSGAMDLHASLSATGTLPDDIANAKAAAIPLLGRDPESRQALATALRQIHIQIGALHLLRSAGQTYVTLGEPATISGEGATLQLTASQGALLHIGEGQVRGTAEAALRGPHLPDVTMTIPAYSWQSVAGGEHTLDVTTETQAKFNFGPARGVTLAATGDVTWRDGRFAFLLRDCADISVSGLLSKRARVVRDAKAQLCERDGQALFSTESGGWNLDGRWRALSAQLISAQARLASSQGEIALESRDGVLKGHVAVAAARIQDRARAQRFAPITISGTAKIAGNALQGGFDLAAAGKKRLGHVTLAGTIARGRADIRMDNLSFRQGGLQPRDLSPMLATIAQAKGSAGMTGHIAWTARGMTSRGDISIHDLDFTSPAGRVEGANGDIKLSSLVPLSTAPGQTISVAKIAWVTPLTNLTATFQMTALGLSLASARGGLSGGHISLAPLELIFASTKPVSGKISLHNVDIGGLIAASSLGTKLKASGAMSGTIPFRIGPNGVSFTDGHIATVGPANLSISRTVWGSDDPQGKSGAVRNFAYQALEHLAIDSLDGTVNSLSNGRLELLLHVKGHYAPEKPQNAEVGLFDLLQGKAFDKPISLPKGTAVNLTLDTSLNFAELLAAYRKAWTDSTAPAAHSP